jgi:hypothetical protein
MRSIAIVGACFVLVAAIVTTSLSVSYASDSELRFGDVSPMASFGPTPTPSVVESENSSVAKELAVFTDQGIAPARARQALDLQGEVAEAHLIVTIRAALGNSYAGVWFEPAAARFHVGVTSNASRQAVERTAAQAGLAADVVATRVRSTWGALIAAQSDWNRRLADLLAAGEAETGVDPSRNAVSIILGSSVSSKERIALKNMAATTDVNDLVSVSTSSQLGFEDRAKKNCIAPFATRAAYCEETITSGVTILTEKGVSKCTAGPMLIEGDETYMLTAGHCFGKLKLTLESETIKEEVTSQYTEGPQLEIGSEGLRYYNTERDTAEVRVNRAAKTFTEPLPDPVPALMAEWVLEPKKPHAVGGVEEPATFQSICHEGQTSGEKCGEVKLLNVTRVEVEHLVEVTACGSGGDSGGPYFVKAGGGEILMEGTEVGGPLPDCTEPGPHESFFEPLVDLGGATGFGILSTFKQELLTTANEVRTSGEVTLLAEWLANGSAVSIALSTETTSEFLLEDQAAPLVGKAAILCNGIFDGTVGPNGEGLVEKLLNLAKEEIASLGGLALLGTGAGSDCVKVLACAEGTVSSPIEVWPKNLPWSISLFLMETGAIAELVKNAAYEILCLIFGLNIEDACEASEQEFTVVNDPVSGDASIPAEQVGLPLANCSMGGSQTGAIATDAVTAIALTGGELLTVSSE